MIDNLAHLETAQIELLHQQAHDRAGAGEEDCDLLRTHHDSLAAELVKRGIAHDTEMICPEKETNAPHYRRGFTDDVCANCAFGQLRPYCNLYKFNYTPDFVCDSFRYYEVLELEPPHGFLMAQEKQTALATVKSMDSDRLKLVTCNGEVFGIAEFETDPAQLKEKDFDAEDWLTQHRVTPRERRQWWPGAETFYVYRLKNWYPYKGVKLYENGCVIDEPRLTVDQWKIVSAAKELPKQIIINADFVQLTEDYGALCGDEKFYNREVKAVFDATFNRSVDWSKSNDEAETIPVYSLALVRNPRMRVSKKNPSAEGAEENEAITEKQEGENMPYNITRNDDGEYCVVKTDTDEIQGCHDTEEEAEAQLTALRINVEAEEDEAAVHTDKPPKKRKPKKEFIESETTFMERLKLAAKNILDIVTLAETEETEDTKLFMNDVGIGQKIVNGELWHLTYSTNAFRDRDGEIFSTKALENYVSVNENNADKGFFNLWHINAEDGNFNTDFAKKEWQGVIGRFLVEAGPYLRDEKGRAARKFFKKFGDRHPEIAPEGWGCSPEYKYLPEERASGTYENIWITRTSTLPKMAAANIWTETRQMKHGSKTMALSDQQKKAAIEMFGGEFVNQMISEAESKTIDLEQAGVAHKSESENEAPQSEPEPQEIQLNIDELAVEVGKQFQADLMPIAEAMAAMAGSLKEMDNRLQNLEETKQVTDKTEIPRFVFQMQRASEAEETIVTDDDGLKKKKPAEAKSGSNDPWAQMFNK